MRVVVSGATGFLGGHLARRLLAEGHEVIGLGRDAAAGQRLVADGVRFQPIDLALSDALPGEAAEGFVHAAALSSNWGSREAFHAANVTGTAHALALARRLGVRRFVHISSPSVGFRFADQLGVTEEVPLPRPVNAYARSKAQAESLVLSAGDLSPVVLRPRGLFGPGDRALLPRLVRAARSGPLPLLRGGEAVTDLTHAEDGVSAIAAALLAGPQVAGRVYNISGGEPLPVRRIAELAAARAGVSVRWRAVPVGLALLAARALETRALLTPGRPEPVVTAYSVGVMAYSQTLDISRAARELGWRPRIGVAAGIAAS
ncbi:NAD-dependent epimerase/dehydratase family protein [Devosia sp.]|uniref:NAD-dependent epimerase/dehydratase family protein n=1 Tax=Devosia sp. TaxID=1871048 RepID=UPI0035AE84D5